MNDIKVNLTIVLPGRIMFSEEESSEPLKHSTHTQVYTAENGQRTTISYQTRNCKPVRQSLNMSSEAYEYMTDPQSKPVNYSGMKSWGHISKKERLEWHLKETAQALGGEVESYKVF